VGLCPTRRGQALFFDIARSAWPSAIRDALIPVAIGLSFASAYTMGWATLTNLASVLIAGGAAIVLWRTRFPTPLVLLACGLLGAIILR